jgi:PAS domain S-box-containing protein
MLSQFLALPPGIIFIGRQKSACNRISICQVPLSPVYDPIMTASIADRISKSFMEFVLKPLGIAIAFVIVALIWTFPLQHVISYPFVFLFFGAVMGTAWFGGMVAGLISVALSSLLITYLFIPPLYSMAVAKGSQSFLAAFVACAIAITFVSSARKRAEETIREARDHLEEKVQERTAELERSNREIRESARQLRLLTEAIPQQIWRADVSGSIEYCNHHLIEYLGKPLEEISGEGFFRTLHPEDEPIFRHAWQAALESGGNFEVQVRVRNAVETYRWFLVRSIPQRNEDGSIARWYGIHIDIEEQYQAQQNLANEHEKQARIAHTLSMAEMAASIAHELNQPLTAVMTHAYACREWLLSEPANVVRASATADKIVQESTRAGEVVRRVRALFRKEAHVREHADLSALIQESARLLRDEAIRHSTSISLAVANDLPRLQVDPVQIQQVLFNLAINGMEAMTSVPRNRKITIRAERKNDQEALISVEDQGAGFPPEVAAHVFEPFFTTKSEGIGMGLAICRSIIEAHDGRIWTQNVPGGGAAVQFTLRNRQ